MSKLKSPPKPSPSVVAELDQLKAEMLDRWRGWARAISEGSPPPTARELLEVATVLQIPAPAEALEGDAEALRTAAGYEVGIAAAEVATKELLAKHGGSLQAFRLKIEGLEAEVRELKSQFVLANSGGRSEHLLPRLDRLHATHSRVFPKEARR